MLVNLEPRESSAHMRVVLFPHAGAGVGAYAGWQADFPDWLELWVVQLPGRGARAAEPMFTCMSDLTDAVATALQQGGLLSAPLAFFGHSFGALVAFETAQVLRARGLSTPACLILSGHESPSMGLPDTERGLASLPDEALRTALDRWDFTALARSQGVEDVMDPAAGMLSTILAPMRADLQLREELLSTPPTAPTAAAIHVCGGADDASVPESSLRRWAELTEAAFSCNLHAMLCCATLCCAVLCYAAVLHLLPSQAAFSCEMLPGGHFFLDRQLEPASHEGLVAALCARARDALARLPPSVRMGAELPMPQEHVHEMVLRWVARAPDALAVVCEGVEMTYAQVGADARLLASWLVARGAAPREHVAVLLPHGCEWLLAQLGIGMAGAGVLSIESYFGAEMMRATIASHSIGTMRPYAKLCYAMLCEARLG